MKKIIFVLGILFMGVSIPLMAQLIPFGMVKASEGLYVDYSEITVADWLKYYYYSTSFDTLSPSKELLPTFDEYATKKYKYLFFCTEKEYEIKETKNHFGKVYALNHKFNLPYPKDSLGSKKQTKKYLKNLEVLNLPITNLTYEQVVGFCRWRTYIYNNDSDALGLRKIKFALPSAKQFNLYRDTNSTTYYVKGKDTIATLNCSNGFKKNQPNIGLTVLKTSTFNSTGIGVDDVQGNVSEMLNEKNKAIGGSYLHSLKECISTQIQTYEGPQPWVGFRCVAFYPRPVNEF